MLSVDIALFYNVYNNLSVRVPGAPTLDVATGTFFFKGVTAPVATRGLRTLSAASLLRVEDDPNDVALALDSWGPRTHGRPARGATVLGRAGAPRHRLR
jgi:hypothetical protein